MVSEAVIALLQMKDPRGQAKLEEILSKDSKLCSHLISRMIHEWRHLSVESLRSAFKKACWSARKELFFILRRRGHEPTSPEERAVFAVAYRRFSLVVEMGDVAVPFLVECMESDRHYRDSHG